VNVHCTLAAWLATATQSVVLSCVTFSRYHTLVFIFSFRF